MLKELKEIVDETLYERVLLNKLSLSQKSNPKFIPTHYSITPGENGFDDVVYYKEK